MIKTTFRIIKDKPSGANDLSAERTYLNKVWVDVDSELEFLKSFFFDYEGRVVNNLTKNEILFKIERRIEELMR